MLKSPHGYDTKSWNPVTGCTKVSQGCKNCWAEEYSRRMGWPWKVTLHPARLDEPLKWRKPQVASVAFMGDLFHEDVGFRFVSDVFGVIAAQQKHTFLVLTKRPERMQAFVEGFYHFYDEAERAGGKLIQIPRPLPNLFLGVSVEDQASADERIPLLLETPAAHRWVSAEPLLCPVNFKAEWFPENVVGVAGRHEFLLESFPGIEWVVVGGESGPRYRPCDPAWIADILAQCDAASVPCFVKQASHRYPGRQGDIPDALFARKEVPW